MEKLFTKTEPRHLLFRFARSKSIFLLIFFLLFQLSLHSQNVGINVSGNAANSKALLDIDVTGMTPTKAGLLIPRMSTSDRDAISGTIPESLLIYNTTTQCYEGYNATTSTWVAFGCIGCTAPTAVTATPSPNPVCIGGTLTLTGAATNALSWSWTGPNGFTSSLQSPTIAGITTAAAGVYTLTAGNTCAFATPVNSASVSISALPTTANAGSDINPPCSITTATLAGNAPTDGAGTWSVASGVATISNVNSPTSGVSGLAAAGSATLRWTISNAPCTDSFDEVIITTTSGAADGAVCGSDAGCCSGICGTDTDGDGYFSLALGHTGTCQVTSKPYTDCYDANASAYPGQTSYFTVNRGDGSFDYNCDGSTTNSAPQTLTGTIFNSHSTTRGDGACQQSIDWWLSTTVATPACGTAYSYTVDCNFCGMSAVGCITGATGYPWPLGFYSNVWPPGGTAWMSSTYYHATNTGGTAACR